MSKVKILALIGMRCCGKSVVGAALARRLGRSFVDLDDAVLACAVEAGVAAESVGGLLVDQGLECFRDFEAQALQNALGGAGGIVLATGGGVVELPDNRARLRRGARCVWLNAPLATLRERLEQQVQVDPVARPPLTGADAVRELAPMLERRRSLYRGVAHHTLTGDESVDSMVGRIEELLEDVK